MKPFQLDFAKGGGLVPAIAQDWQTGEILMQAYLSAESWAATLREGYAVYYSRSRRELWKKGATSGHLQKIHDILVDCDSDCVIFKVEQIGRIACHTGHRSCFFRRIVDGEAVEIGE